MPIYDERLGNRWPFARSFLKKAEELAPLEELGVLPHRVHSPTSIAEEPSRPRAARSADGGLVVHPYGYPLQRKACLQREWLHLEVQRYRRQIEQAQLEQAKEAREREDGEVDTDLPQRLQARQGKGNPLPHELHSRLEEHLGTPLPKIVIHTDDKADELAETLEAEAFTHGNDIFFRKGAYDPHSEAGQKLIAHEAAHVLQQSQGLAQVGIDADAGLEEQARQVEQSFTPRPAMRQELTAGLTVQLPAEERQWLDEGSAMALRSEYRGIAHKLVQAYRQGLSARETAQAIRKAEAATQMPVLEAVLTFLGRAEGLKGSLLQAYRGQAPQPTPTPTSAQPALQRQATSSNRPRLADLEPNFTFDAFLEQIATNLAYSNLPDLENQIRDSVDERGLEAPRRGSNPAELLKVFGFTSDRVIYGRWGLQARAFLPDPKRKTPYNQRAILAFRGTEGMYPAVTTLEAKLDTAIGDMTAEGAGYPQYQQNQELIARNLEFVARKSQGGKAVLTGHSLGGALAQITAAKHPNLTDQVVTFMAPAIRTADAKTVDQYNRVHKDDPIEARHYRVEGDLVPLAGEKLLTGKLYTFERRVRKDSNQPWRTGGLWGAVIDTHLTHPLAHLIDQQGATNPYQQAIDQHGAHDPYLNSSETAEVNIKWSGAYDLSKDKDPRLNLSQPHLATAPQKYYWAAVDVYYDRIAYTTLLEAIEAIAKRHDQYPAFRKAALEFIGSTDRLPLSKDALLLAQQIQIKDFEESIFFYIKSRFAKMKEEGVKIEQDQKDKIRGDLLRIWASWHPDKEVAR